MQRILHIITGLKTGGAENMLYKLLSGADRQRFHPTVISLTGKGTIGPRIESLGITVHTLNIRQSGLPTPQTLWDLAVLVRQIRPHVIQGWMYHGNLATSYAAIICGRIPFSWNIRQSLYSLKYEKKGTTSVIKLGAFISRLPERIIYNSHESVLHHEKFGYCHNKSIVIPNGFDTALFRPDDAAATGLRAELNIPAGALLIGLIARYHPMKDHETFLRAAALLINRYPQAYFVLAGKDVDCRNEALQRLINALGLTGHISMLGERDDVSNITAALDIATSSSYAEAFPNVIGEAMSCGIPCAVTDVGDSALLVGETGKVAPPRNPQVLADAWGELISMGVEQRRNLGREARLRICELFSLDAIVKKYEALHEQLIAMKG